MTFDMEKARAAVAEMSPLPWIVLEDESGQMTVIRNPNHPMHRDDLAAWGQKEASERPDARGIAYMRTAFPAALDEIERLRTENENAIDLVNANWNEQAKRIAELEADKKYWHDISGKQMQTVEQQHSRILKQRAALKKLAAKYRERGKALVEERAHAIECNPNRTREWTHAEAKKRAREQLRREGKI